MCNSHIIPAFYYKKLGDDKNRFYMLDVDPSSTTKDQLIQKSPDEKLLCVSCESIINKFEHYIAHVFYKKPSEKVNYEMSQENGFTIYRNLDYKKFKLFQLSILWRASVSSLGMFRCVELGINEEKIRKMILEGNPGTPREFGCLMYVTHDGNNESVGLILPVNKKYIRSHRVYIFMFGGIHWTFIASKHFVGTSVTEKLIQLDGELRMKNVNFEETPLFESIAQDMLDKKVSGIGLDN